MEPALEQRLPRIRALRPDLDLSTARLNQDGLINDVVIVEDAWVFRFARSERGVQALAGELQVLAALAGRLPVAVPVPVHAERDLVVYPYLPGQPLSRALWLSWTPAARARLAAELGAALHALHTTPLPADLPRTRAPVTRAVWEDLRVRVEARIAPLLQAHQLVWLRGLWAELFETPDAFAFSPALIHGDIDLYHWLYDPATGRLTGLIDFGMAGAGDPANDLAILLQILGESALESFAPAYPLAEPVLRRARRYAQTIELEWVLNGLESGETFWFTAHLGNARDLRV